MTKVTITQAAKMVQISRSYFYKKYVNPGKISVLNEDGTKLVDVSELIRVFGSIQTEDTPRGHENTVQDTVSIQSKDKIILLLEKQLAESKEREEWLKTQLEKTTLLLEHKKAKREKWFGIF